MMGVMMAREERQYSERPHPCDVTIESPGGSWSGTATDLGLSRARVTLAGGSATPPLWTIVQLRIALPDGNSPLTLPTRVVERDSDGVSLSFFNVKEDAQQRLKDFLGCLPSPEYEVSSHPSRSNGSSNSEPQAPPPSSVPPQFVETTRSAERAATADRPADGNTDALEEPRSEESEERFVSRSRVPSRVPSDETGVKELLGLVGLPGLCLPSNGVLSPQWQRFLEQLGPKASYSSTGSRSSRLARLAAQMSGRAGSPSRQKSR